MSDDAPQSTEELKTVRVADGVELSYRIQRGGGSPRRLVVLLHGLASNMTRWSELVEHTRLKSTWDLLRIDLRGHGRSMWRGKLEMETWCRDLRRVMDAEHYHQAVVVGHSLGAQIALYFAYWNPDRTAGLVLIDPVLSGALLGHLRVASRFTFLLKAAIALIRLLNRLGIHRRRIPGRDLRVLDERMREELLDGGRTDELVKRYSSIKPDLKHFPTASFLQEIVQMVRPLPELTAISAPTLVILSSGTTYTDPDATREAIENFRQSTLVTIDAYHWPLTEKPAEVRRTIESWVAGLDTG